MAEIIKVKCTTRYINEQMFDLVYVTFNENIFRHIDDDFVNEITTLFFYVKVWERQDRTTIGLLKENLLGFDCKQYAIHVSRNLSCFLDYLRENRSQLSSRFFNEKDDTEFNYNDPFEGLYNLNPPTIDDRLGALNNYYEFFPIGIRCILYESVRKIKDGFYAVMQGNLWGVVDEKGNKIIDIKYHSIEFIKKNSCFTLNNQIKEEHDNYTDTYDENVNIGIVFLHDSQNGGYDVLTTDFKKIHEGRFHYVRIKQNYFIMGNSQSHLAYFTYDGKQMTEFDYEAFKEQYLHDRLLILGYKFNYIGVREELYNDYDLHNNIYDAYDEFGNCLFKGFTSFTADDNYVYVHYEEFNETCGLFSMKKDKEHYYVAEKMKTIILDNEFHSIIPTEAGQKLSLLGVFYDNDCHCFYYGGTKTQCPIPIVKILDNQLDYLKIEFMEIPSWKPQKSIIRKKDNAVSCMFGDIFYCESDMYITAQHSVDCDWLYLPFHLTTDKIGRIARNQEIHGRNFGISSIENLLLPYEYERIYFVGNRSFIIHHYQKKIGIFVDNKIQLSCDYDFVTVPINGFSFVGKATDFLTESIYAIFLYDIQEDVLFSVNNNVPKEELIEAIHSGALKIDINREARSRNDISICDHKIFSVEFKSQFTLRTQSQNIRISYDLPYCVYTSNLMSEEEIRELDLYRDDDCVTVNEDKYTYEDALYDGLGGEMSAFVNLGF